MAKESLLDRLRSKPTEAPDEEGKLRKELMELRIQHSSGQLKETHKIREIRRHSIKVSIKQRDDFYCYKRIISSNKKATKIIF